MLAEVQAAAINFLPCPCLQAGSSSSRDNAFRSGHFNVAVRELIAYYISLVCCLTARTASAGLTIPACMHACTFA
jgi:hypothetical protein